MTQSIPAGQRRFSFKAFVIVAFLHSLSSTLLGGAAFSTGMSAFTENVSGEMALFRFVGWLWTPPQMLAIQDPSGAFGLGGLFLITLAWSSIVGLVFGFLIPCVSKALHEHN